MVWEDGAGTSLRLLPDFRNCVWQFRADYGKVPRSSIRNFPIRGTGNDSESIGVGVGRLAQLVEQRLYTAKVGSSRLSAPTTLDRETMIFSTTLDNLRSFRIIRFLFGACAKENVLRSGSSVG